MESIRKNLIPTIKLENVSMYYSNQNNINVGFSKISLDFYKGEFVAITGESGSGKTSLINAIGASLPYHEGEIYYDGNPSSHFGDIDRETFRRERIGYVCQNYNLIDSYTLLQNVMASMIISGFTEKEAKLKAIDYLDKVGLKDLANRKASKISSGQKQRLSIARALAKETDIILADEPTGNLDSENGKQIVKILKDLSKDHLVIMVTHNLEEAIDYVSRVIQMSDGHVVYDEIKDNNKEIYTCEEIKEKEVKEIKNAFTFASFNRKAKPKRAFIISLYLLLVSFASFVLIGTIIVNLDESLAKKYDDSLFLNQADNRLILLKDDNSAFNDDDIKKLQSAKYVTLVDKYDIINDFNYFTEAQEDLIYEYYEEYIELSPGDRDESSRTDHKTPVFQNYKKFLKSTSCITSDMIKCGSIPTKVNEIAVYGDESLLNTKQIIYIQNKKLWNMEYLSYEMTITCVLNDDENVSSDQIYVSEILSKELCNNAYALSKYTYTCQDKSLKYPNGYKKFKAYVFTDDIGQGNISVSHNLFSVSTKYENMIISINNQVYNLYSHSEIMSQLVVKLDTSVEEEFFYGVLSYQASVYIEDYAYTDEAIELLNEMGYGAISTYRVSTVDYDDDLLTEKYVSIIVCVASLIIIFVLTMFVLSSFLGLNKNDYYLLRLLGMNKKTMYLTNLFELSYLTIIMFIISIVLTIILNAFDVNVVHNIVKYMSFYHFIIIFIIVMIIVLFTTNRFNKSLEKKIKTTGEVK